MLFSYEFCMNGDLLPALKGNNTYKNIILESSQKCAGAVVGMIVW